MGCRGLGWWGGGAGESDGPLQSPLGARGETSLRCPILGPPPHPTTSPGGSHRTCGGSGSGGGRSPLSSHRQYGGGGGGDTRLGRQPQGPERGCSRRCRKRKPPSYQEAGRDRFRLHPQRNLSESGHAGMCYCTPAGAVPDWGVKMEEILNVKHNKEICNN